MDKKKRPGRSWLMVATLVGCSIAGGFLLLKPKPEQSMLCNCANDSGNTVNIETPDAAACPAPPVADAVASPLRSGSSQALFDEVVSCLQRPRPEMTRTGPHFQTYDGFADVSDRCWREYRHRQYIDVIRHMTTLPPTSLSAYKDGGSFIPFELIVPTYECDRNFYTRVGSSGDGGKWICGPLHLPEQDCTIFSLGSNGQFDFEESIYNFTRAACKTHTFDCTGDWSNPTTTFHRWCVGTDDAATNTKSLQTISKELGVRKISLLKMDVEGAEFKVFKSFLNEPKENLPVQILFELHTWGRRDNLDSGFFGDIAEMILLLDSLGYRFASKEINKLCNCCAEFVLVHNSSFPFM
eukprot:TRINITY_DN11428_c0_g1_i1.p2 TRINITY_DN11428_c0_g1~~TRINITY_DN11428_c0_g1_i1.p2  ORF type:complete len:353 (-),score=55.41 TRINITY_DN11428_c0_g1_i1:2-1060(-)